MRAHIDRNPEVQNGVDTACCPDAVAELLTAIVATSCGEFSGTLVFDADGAETRQWLGRIDVVGLGWTGTRRRRSIELALVCQRRGWRIVLNGRCEEEPVIEESTPLYLQFTGVRLLDSEPDAVREEISITVTE